MFVECAKMKGRTPYLRVSETYGETKDGATKIKKRIIRNIGPLSRFDDGMPDFVGRLKRSFKDGTPLIKELEDLAVRNPTRDILTVRFDRRVDSYGFSHHKNIGYFIFDALYDALGIYDVLNLHKSRSKIEYDLNGLAKLLVFGRALSPDSKIGTFEDRNRCAFGVTSSENPIETYRTLDVLDKKAESVQKRMNLKIASSVGRNTEMCFYDVTNFWFEIGENDPDEKDEEGKVVRPGLRKKGV